MNIHPSSLERAHFGQPRAKELTLTLLSVFMRGRRLWPPFLGCIKPPSAPQGAQEPGPRRYALGGGLRRPPVRVNSLCSPTLLQQTRILFDVPQTPDRLNDYSNSHVSHHVRLSASIPRQRYDLIYLIYTVKLLLTNHITSRHVDFLIMWDRCRLNSMRFPRRARVRRIETGVSLLPRLRYHRRRSF